jgi:hypothetical protein
VVKVVRVVLPQVQADDLLYTLASLARPNRFKVGITGEQFAEKPRWFLWCRYSFSLTERGISFGKLRLDDLTIGSEYTVGFDKDSYRIILEFEAFSRAG